jgi:hypothetical protein
LAQSDGHDSPGLIDELVPRHTAVVDEIVVRFEDAVRQPVVTQELPDVLRWSRGALGRVPRFAQRRVILFFWPIRASSANQISIVSMPTAFSRAIASRKKRRSTPKSL